MRHLGENLKKSYKCGELIHAYTKGAKVYGFDEFENFFRPIRVKNAGMAKYLEHDVGLERWSRCHFPGRRFDVMTTNIAESINSKLKLVREYPIVSLFDAIQRMLSRWFNRRRTESNNWTNILVPLAEGILRGRDELSKPLFVYPLNDHEFTVRGYGPDAMVNLMNKTCTCRVFDIQRLPCPHALAALLRQQERADYGVRVYEDLCSPYYRSEYYKLAYAETIYPIPSEDQWVVPEHLTEIIIRPPLVKRQRGRRRVNRYRSCTEAPRKRNRCSNCKQPGHKRSKCKQGAPSVCTS